MNLNKPPETTQKNHKLAVRFRNINMVLLITSLVTVASVVTVMVMNITRQASENYARFYAVEAVEKFSAYLSQDLALVHKVSSSQAVTSWFADENDPWKRIDAYVEMMDYAGMLKSASLYFCINQSLHEFSVESGATLAGFTPFDTIDPNIPYNSWYFNCISSPNEYTLNIDIDKVTQTRRMWINHQVVDAETGNILGVFCSALPFDEMLGELFGQYNLENVRGFIIDGNGNIQMDSYLFTSGQQDDGEDKRPIYEVSADPAFQKALGAHLAGIDGLFTSRSESEVIRLKQDSYGYMSIAPISGTDWSVITFFNENSLFGVSRLLPLLIAMLAAFVLYMVANSILMRRLVLKPLNQLTDSVSTVSAGAAHIYGSERGDEFGELAQTIQQMHDSLNDYNAEILLSAAERERQGRMLSAMNGAAAVLLAADEHSFESSLKEGMELMAHCINVDRVYIWQNEMKNGALHYAQKFEWLSGYIQQKNPAQQHTSFAYSDTMPEWEDILLRGECVNGPLNSLSTTASALLAPLGIKSVLVIPVYLQKRFWGFVSFDDCHTERTFTADEVDILRSSSLMLASSVNRNITAAKMREADERTKLMLDAMPLCCNLWNKNMQNIDCNEAAVKLFELADEQEYLDKFFQLSPEYQPDGQLSNEKAVSYIEEAFKNGRVVFEWLHQKLDGTPVPAEVTLVRMRHGEEDIVIGYTRDLREHNKMMREIEYQDELLHTVNSVASILLQSEMDKFESDLWHCMGMLAGSVDADRVYIWKNHLQEDQLYCTQIYEWSEGAEPQQGMEYTVNIPYSENMPGWKETLSAGQCVNNIVRNLSAEEQAQLSPQGILSILVVPVFWGDYFWGFVGFDDCHQERIFSQTEESILRSGSLLIAHAMLRNEMTINISAAKSKLEAVITNYSGVIWSVDKNNIITLFDGLYLKELGIKPEFIEGKSLEIARHRNRHLDIIENVQKTFAEGPQDWISEIDGSMYRAHTTPICDENGQMTGVVGSIDDITDTIRLQQELESAVHEAQAASRAKSNFLSNMSHEMRTPMNAIIGMTMIGKAAGDTERKDYAFGKIEDASNHLLGVINDILDMSKIEANKFELSEVEFRFEQILQKVVNVISFRIDEKQQQFTVHLDENIPPSLIGDDQRLTQIITNLLSNAVKFTPEQGSIRLDTRFIKEQDGLCSIQIEVKDTGIGISAEQQARLFNSFEQAESSTSRKFGGTGLGLAISKHIIELMGGSIWVESQLGMGSTFAFTIQLRRGASPCRSLLNPGVNWQNIRVLAVDDEQETREYFANIGEQFKIACDTAASGAEAMELIDSRGSYNIYFVDWQMPGMNGIELAHKIKEHDADRSIVIMISAATWNEIEKDAKNAGVDMFLPKPLFPSAIADCINKCIGLEDNLAGAGAPSLAAESFAGYCVLLAEDVEINREIVLALLEPSQLTIDCAGNGAEALQMFAAAPERYDMIFMDVQMPEMDGLTATQLIRELDFPQAKTIPIIAMTANVFREDVEKCLEIGMNDHVGKPLDFEEVMKKMKRYLKPERYKKS